ncbi:hypothetical protein DPMN_120258 [Dreissena polymorpha]|uniref:Uncharacterized protein n=1 Tax=Dreissena polymorpha TaxID=45954 RepID=A0A9D4GR83_DREPO|nr:hypothetical protein DPMN_120258 [Dreissena polymorpha]
MFSDIGKSNIDRPHSHTQDVCSMDSQTPRIARTSSGGSGSSAIQSSERMLFSEESC